MWSLILSLLANFVLGAALNIHNQLNIDFPTYLVCNLFQDSNPLRKYCMLRRRLSPDTKTIMGRTFSDYLFSTSSLDYLVMRFPFWKASFKCEVTNTNQHSMSHWNEDIAIYPFVFHNQNTVLFVFLLRYIVSQQLGRCYIDTIKV